jgi:hypothetical protein
MALSVVNGFLCYCSCDVKKALQGKNPHPKQDPTNPAAQQNGDDSNSSWQTPAVVLDGALKASRNHRVTPVSAAEAAAAAARNRTSTFETVA